MLSEVIMMIPDLRSRSLLVLFLSSIYFSLIISHVSSVSFYFNFSDSNSANDNIKLEGGASIGDGKISLTIDSKNSNLTNSTGRATYRQPVPLWDVNTGKVANFTTRFSFLIQNTTPDNFGDGLAFFLSEYPSQLPPHADNEGKYLGLFNSTTYINPSVERVVAVEFDTYLNNNTDPSSEDITDCHIGIDIGTIYSTSHVNMSNSLFVGTRMTAEIEYNSFLKFLQVSVWHENNETVKFNLNATVDIINQLPNVSAVGFSAATGASVELHQIFWWSFNSSLILPLSEDPSPTGKIMISVPLLGGIIACTFILFILVVVLIYRLRKRSSTETIGEIEVFGDESIDYEFENGRGPKRFSYSELVDATNGFGENNKLGEGGFGSVYRGILKNGNFYVAVKRVSKESQQGRKEYISEVKIISQLRHRNLVQLIGWCHDHGELLLVYELLHNGSLDKHLHRNETLLTWPIRHNIALGLGSAVLYLHEECQQCVVHRDIKPSNIMLDASFNAKLGDFGLARLIDHDQDIETVAAGTKGYIAPECTFGIANANIQSDIFSFGVVLLEIVCGRRPIMPQQDQRKVSLVDWVWDLYGRNALLEAVDRRLNGAFNEKVVMCMMVVGLWCAHPDNSLRPSIRQAMSVLHFQSGLPVLPPKKPVPVFTTSLDPNMQPSTSSEATSSGATKNSTKFAPAPVVSSNTSLLFKQEPKTF